MERLTTNHRKPVPRIEIDDLYSVPVFKEQYQQLFKSAHELDYLLRNREVNGLAACGAVVTGRNRRRLTIVAPLFKSWLLGEVQSLENSSPAS